jgi:N,N'-diacetyllegionaminate synthase
VSKAETESVFTSSRNPVLFIAEVGGNHEGDEAYLRRLHSLAVASGADAVKYQLYRGDTLVSRVEGYDRNQHFKRFEIPLRVYGELADDCAAAGVEFMASSWDFAMVDWVDPLVKMHKVGSGDLTCYPMLKRLVRTGKPIILSTGLSMLDEVAAAVEYIGSLDECYITSRKLAILQCTSSYPCPDEDANLNAIVTLRDRFGLPTGFSDHTEGALAIEAAVALGAEIIEKHFTDDRAGKTFRDHKVSLTAAEIRELMPRLARIRSLRGSATKEPTAAEVRQAHVTSFRRSVYASRDIAAGERFTSENLTVLRPAVGISASRFDDVLGKTAQRALKTHDVVRDSDVG